jgi:protoporphyrinogen oxidase
MAAPDPTKHWAVVGGGILGMTLAHRLAQRGLRVTLIESQDHLGGLADAWQLGDVTWDRHYHVTLLSDRFLRGLLRELDLEREIRWTETRTGFYVDGRLHSMSIAWEFLRFPPLRLIDKIRLALTILRASRVKEPGPLDEIPVADWLRRWSGGRTLEKIWLPLLRAKLGEGYQRTSAAFIWTTIARMYAARRTGLKKEMFGYVPGGYARILDRMGRMLAAEGVEIRCGQPAEEVAPCDRGTVAVRFVGGEKRQFDRVVLTAPAPVVARICPGLSDDERHRLEAVEYLGVRCASLLLKRALAGFYVTNITDSWVPFTAVIEMTALVDPAQFGGRSLVYLPKYLPAGDPGFDLPGREIEETSVAALERMYPAFRRDDVLAFRVSRARHVMALPTLGHCRNAPPTRTSLPGVYLVNSAQIVHGTLNVNETIRLADEATPQILA